MHSILDWPQDMVPYSDLLAAKSEARLERESSAMRADQITSLELRLAREEQELLATRSEVVCLRRKLAASKMTGETASILASAAEVSISKLREEVLGLQDTLMQKEREVDEANTTALVRYFSFLIFFYS